MVRRLMSLESAVTEANKFAEAERVRCEQSEAVTESLLASSHRHDQLLAYHGKVNSSLSCFNHYLIISTSINTISISFWLCLYLYQHFTCCISFYLLYLIHNIIIYSVTPMSPLVCVAGGVTTAE